jgi:hypothetical protein
MRRIRLRAENLVTSSTRHIHFESYIVRGSASVIRRLHSMSPTQVQEGSLVQIVVAWHGTSNLLRYLARCCRREKYNHHTHLGFSGLAGWVDGLLEVLPVLKWTSDLPSQPAEHVHLQNEYDRPHFTDQ